MIRKTLLLVLFATFFFQAGSPLVYASQSKTIEKEIRQEKKALKSIKSKLGAETKKIKKEKKKEKSVLGSLGIINKKLGNSKKAHKKYSNDLKETKIRLLKTEVNLSNIKNKIKLQKTLLQKRLKIIYKEGESNYLKVVFSAEDPNDFLQRLKYMKIIADFDAKLISQYNANSVELQATREALQKETKQVANLKKLNKKKYGEILSEKKEKQRLLHKIRNRKSTHEKIRKELLEASKELNSLINILEKSYREEKKVTFPKRKGHLPWPIKGEIISKFGKVKNKRFQTFQVNNGIEIKTPVGKKIRAIHDGEVLYSDNLKGYGLMVILGHGKGYYSLYAHLSKSNVKKGDKIKKKQSFALSGDSDSINGPSLYFEIRKKRTPENPLKWLSLAKR